MLLTDTLPIIKQAVFEEAKFKIAVEVQRIFRPHKHGMDIVAQELLKRLPLAEHGIDYHVMVKEDTDQCLSTIRHRIVHTIRKAPYFIWEQLLLPRACKKIKADLLHCTANTAPIYGQTPLILTLHDVIFLDHSNLRTNSSWYQRFGNLYRRLIVSTVAKKAIHIITVSEVQKLLIIEKLGIPDHKITVIHNGADERFFKQCTDDEIDRTLKKHKIEAGYVFFMANTEPRKNTAGVLQAYAKLLAQNITAPRLVMKGINKMQLSALLKQECLEGLENKIDLIGYVDRDDLPAIYQAASMLWFPSFTEGFGLPIIEAMAGGVPVITSFVSCMPEIAGDAALLVDPANPATIASAANLILNDEGLARELSVMGKKRAALFTWDAATSKTIEVYHRVEKMI